ncbi:D-Ala-D-Ala carboxypeptidase family metallohydrolase [Haloferula chungangensis]|uniref:D-Ala-D-Ala carboxypeptidase family metallohydrolase n=1 Tax=Haloferula chungangensis TaxID=1048331 RepID=A0ABW2L2N6_9BACT
MQEDQAFALSSEEFKPTRRRVLGAFGVSSLALIASSTPASAFFFAKKEGASSLDLSSFPSEWVHRQGRNLTDYANFIGSLKLRNVRTEQVIAAHAKRRGSVWNSLPPKSLWKNAAPTLKVIDRLSAELNQPVKEIVSAYRSPAYNARCAGAKRGSWHQANVAMDVKFPIRASIVTSRVRSLRSRGMFKGGVGSYWNFTHIDTRGQSVDW